MFLAPAAAWSSPYFINDLSYGEYQVAFSVFAHYNQSSNKTIEAYLVISNSRA